MQKARMIQTDATYKLTWQGYPFLVAGTSDADYVFHPLAVAVTKGETEDDFAFLFRALHARNLEWKPEILLADASEAITNGFKAVFGEPDVRAMCFFHVVQNVDKYLRRFSKKNRSAAQELREDINVLQTSKSQQMFL